MNDDEFIPTRRSLLSRLKHLDGQASWQEFFGTYSRLIYRVAVKAGLSDAEAIPDIRPLRTQAMAGEGRCPRAGRERDARVREQASHRGDAEAGVEEARGNAEMSSNAHRGQAGQTRLQLLAQAFDEPEIAI